MTDDQCAWMRALLNRLIEEEHISASLRSLARSGAFGYPEGLIREIEEHHGLRLPAMYRCFLAVFGRDGAEIDNADDMSLKVLFEGREWFEEEMGSNAVAYVLPADAFVFYSRQNFSFYFFRTDTGEDDPPVFHCYDDGSLTRSHEHFSDWLLWAIQRERVEKDFGRLYTVQDDLPGAWEAGAGIHENRADAPPCRGQPAEFRVPLAAAGAPDGSVVVADAVGRRLVRLSPAGEVLACWSLGGPERWQWVYPVAVAIDAAGVIYTAGAPRGRIFRFGPDGAEMGVIGDERGVGQDELAWPSAVAVAADGTLWVADYREWIWRGRYADYAAIRHLAADGGCRRCWGQPGEAPGEFRRPAALALGPTGDIYVADAGNHRVQRLAPDGRPLACFGHLGEAPGEFCSPQGIAVDDAGAVYVSDTRNHRVQKLTPSGDVLWCMGRRGRAPGAFDAPAHLALDVGGALLVADRGNDRIQRLSPDGDVLAVFGQPAPGKLLIGQ